MDQDIDFSKPDLLSQYGIGVQKKLSNFSEKILERVRNKDTPQVGELLNELMVTIKGIDINSLSNPGVFRRLWFKILKEVSLHKGSFELINDQMNFLIYRLEEEKHDLVQDLKSLEATYRENLTIYQELEALIEKADKAILKREIDLNNIESFEGDLLTVQRVKDWRSELKEFEKRVHDLKLTQMMTLQTLPQIRFIQHNNNELIHKIQTSILNTIPVWRDQIVLSLSLEKQKRVSDLQKKILETTNTHVSKNSDLLKENTIAIAELNDDLISVITSVLRIYQEGRVKRKEAEKDLRAMELRLKEALAL